MKACEYFRLIASRLMGDSRYRNYSQDMREDMVSAALEKSIRNIRNYKRQYRDKCFSYFVRCAECAFWTVLKKHYRHMNLVRKMALDYADRIESVNPEAAQRIRDEQITVERTGEKAVRPGWGPSRRNKAVDRA